MLDESIATHPDATSRQKMMQQSSGSSIQPSKKFMNEYNSYAGRSDVKVKRLNESATVPTKANLSDAGWDLYSTENLLIEPNSRALVKTGISFAIPEKYVGLIWPRSGMAVKYGIDVYAGVIDAGYRGEVGVCLFNSSSKDFYIQTGDRIAQVLFQKISQHKLIEVSDLSNSDRGQKGFGSSGI